jgi:glutathione S-transferase
LIQVHRVPFSTNVERVALAAAYKGIEIEWIDHPYDDRAEVVRISGQELVPVLVDGGLVLPDSEAILRLFEERVPEPPLWPRERARRAEVDVFVEWFNRWWKRAPNLVAGGGDEAKYGPRITAAFDRFEALLDGREYLYGEFGVADVIAFPFLKYALLWDEGDEHEFHRILRRWQPIEGRQNVEAWIRRIDALPRA